jgi:hypothetical protein
VRLSGSIEGRRSASVGTVLGTEPLTIDRGLAFSGPDSGSDQNVE